MLLNLAPDQVFAVMLALAVGFGAGLWLWWQTSRCRAAYSELEQRNVRRERAKRIQADIRARMAG